MFNRLFSLLPGKLGSEFRQTFSSLQNRNYRIYSLGQFISSSGTFMQQVALSWITYTLTGSPAALGFVSFAGALPLLLFTYFGGMVADRFDRRKVLKMTSALAMLQAIVLTVLSITGTLNVGWLIALAVFMGCVSAVEVPTRQAFVSNLVSEKELLNAIGLNSAMFNTSRLLGPLFAGLLLGMFGEDICFIANVLSYIPALLTLQMLTVPSNLERKSKDGLTPDAASKRVFDVIFRDATVRAVLLLTFATAMFGFPYSVLLPVITKDVLHGNASILAFMSASAAIGGLIGSLTLARVKNRSTIGRLMGSSVIVLAIAVALLGYSTLLPLSMLCTLVAGAFMSLQFSGGNSLLQTSIDPAIRGRIMAVYSWALMGSAPLSALASGWLAEHFGVPIALGINAAFLVVAALAFLFCVPKAPQEPK